MPAQSLVKCFGKRLTAKEAQQVAHPSPPAADDSNWQPADASADGALQLGPRQSALCGNGTDADGVSVEQTLRLDRAEPCCTGGADCEGKAAEYSFSDTRCSTEYTTLAHTLVLIKPLTGAEVVIPRCVQRGLLRSVQPTY